MMMKKISLYMTMSLSYIYKAYVYKLVDNG